MTDDSAAPSTAHPRLTISTVNIGCPDPADLAQFYEQLLGWQIVAEEPDWVISVP